MRHLAVARARYRARGRRLYPCVHPVAWRVVHRTNSALSPRADRFRNDRRGALVPGCRRKREALFGEGDASGGLLAPADRLERGPNRHHANEIEQGTRKHVPLHDKDATDGKQAGLVIATAIWLPIAAMPEHQLLTWGWRIPFLLSALVAIAGLVIRRKLDETPAFQKAAGEHEVLRIPLAELLRDHRANLLRVACGALASTVSTIFAVYALAFAVKTVGLDDTTMLWVLIVSNVVAMGAIPAWAKVADRIGRKPVFVFGALGSGALMFAYLAAIASSRYVLIFAAAIFMSGVVYSAQNGIWPALFTEMFPTRVRLSGVAIGTQIGFAIGGVGPTIATAIAGNGTDGWVPVAAMVLGFSILAAIGVATTRETYDIPLQELDGPQAEPANHRAGAPAYREPSGVGVG